MKSKISKKQYANHITAAKRRKIYKLFHKNELEITQIMEMENVSFWQVYRAVNAAVKLDGSPRSDKGRSRKNKDGEIINPKWQLDDFSNLDDFQIFLLMDSLEDLARYDLSPQEKIDLVKQIETIQTKIQQRQLQNNMRRPDAELISRIIRRFKPGATNKEIVQIYAEEMDIYLKARNA